MSGKKIEKEWVVHKVVRTSGWGLKPNASQAPLPSGLDLLLETRPHIPGRDLRRGATYKSNGMLIVFSTSGDIRFNLKRLKKFYKVAL